MLARRESGIPSTCWGGSCTAAPAFATIPGAAVQLPPQLDLTAISSAEGAVLHVLDALSIAFTAAAPELLHAICRSSTSSPHWGGPPILGGVRCLQAGHSYGDRAQGWPRAHGQAGQGCQPGRRPRAVSLREQPPAIDRLPRRQLAADLFSQRQVREVHQEENRQLEEKFAIRQRVCASGAAVQSVGLPVRIEPFDEFGRRNFTMATAKGPVDVIQGITELTPQWTKVEGISHVWDMRMATSSIPRDTLRNLLEADQSRQDDRAVQEDRPVLLAVPSVTTRRGQVLEALLAAFPEQTI